MDDNNTILKDLGELVENTKSAVKAKFSYEDVSLSGGFKKAFAKNIASGGNTIEYLKSTAIITTSAGLKIYLPNQWFVLATYPVELIKEIIKYRNYTEKVIDSNASVFVGSNGKALEKKEIYKNLKSTDGIDFSEKFKQIMKDYLLDLGQQEDIANQNCELLYKFVSNDKWWLGGKGIERTNDFYVSPILSVLNLVNASQSYVATITYAYVNDANLYAELETITDADEECNDSFEDEYRRAAKIITDYVSETGFEIPCSRSNIETAIREFQERFSPEKLAAIEDENLLTSLFYTVGDNTEALCCWLEHNADCREYFGSIAGGSAYKFGLFQKKDTGEWMTGSPQKPEVLSEEQALEIGKTIRDALVKGVDIINNAILDNLSDFEKLDEDLKQGVGEQYYNLAWFHKYFSLICPEKLSGFHSNDWQTHVLRCLRINPSEKYYARSAQLAKIENYAGMYYREFFAVVFEEFGGIKHFVRIGTKDDEKNYVAEWQQKSVVGIGWRAIGSLQDYVAGDGIDKDAITEKMMEEYFHDDKKTASRKAGELARFYKTNADTVFVAMNGEKLIAFVDEIGEYFYDASTAMAHMKAGKWHNKFADGDTLPDKSEGKLTSCYQLTNNENLMFLYEKYYYGEEAESEELDNSEAEETYMSLVFNTEIETKYERNRIVFGAPGTGKSYELKEDCEDLLKDTNGSYERVTFHPDYSYSQFVGTYKPVMGADEKIRYAFVPGPFMRVYVEALKSGRTENPQPHLLLIEEINRAKVAAVFGDVFQLLDRDDDGVSEYEIQASEDIRKYLASQLKGDPDNYQKIRIPNNMFIWSTMNSADQGVFPMDTAFKRRWNFEYLGINENEEKISGIGKIELAGSDEPIEWNILRRAINAKMSSDQFKINEDKLMGPFFLSKKVIASDENGMIVDTDKFVAAFKSKVIMYLYEDAVKQGKHRFFDGCDNSKYSSVCDAFDEIGMGIFGSNFKENFYDKQKDEA
jgi:hypothetical protein